MPLDQTIASDYIQKSVTVTTTPTIVADLLNTAGITWPKGITAQFPNGRSLISSVVQIDLLGDNSVDVLYEDDTNGDTVALASGSTKSFFFMNAADRIKLSVGSSTDTLTIGVWFS